MPDGGDGVSGDWDTQRVARTALIVAIVAVNVWMLWRFVPALTWACVLAIATWPLRQMLARRGMGKTAIATVLTLVLAFLLVLPLIGLGVQAARESGALVHWIDDVRQHGLGTPDWLSHVPVVGASLAAWWQANLAEPGAARALFGRAETSGFFSFTRTLGVAVANRITILIFTLLTLFFLYRDGARVTEEAHAIAHRVFGPSGGDIGNDTAAAVRGTVNGLILVGLVEGLLLGITYAATRVPHAALLGLVTAVLATVPFGAPVVFILCAIFLFIQGQTTAAIVLLIIGFALTFVADHFVRPFLIGSTTRLPFLWVLLGILGGLESFGLIGLFIGPAIMSVLITMWREGAGSRPTA
jgi:predicted PurR-regulated permease PerM